MKKSEPLFFFKWYVCEVGYQWIPAPSLTSGERQTFEVSGPFIIDGGALELDHPAPTSRSYRPLEESGLFFRLAATEATMPGVLQFANQYGMLGCDITHSIEFASDSAPAVRFVRAGEPVRKWIKEIFSLRQAVKLWQLVKDRNTVGLAEHIKWGTDGGGVRDVRFHWSSGGTDDPRGAWTIREPGSFSQHVIATDRRPEMMRNLEPGDLIKPALLCIQQLVNAHLSQRVAPQMLWDDDWEHLGFHVVPMGLIGAIWLQLARAITGNTHYRQCGRCEKVFEVSPAAARTNRVFCSDACKTRAYRERKALGEGGTMTCDICGPGDKKQIGPTKGTGKRTADGVPISCHRLECGHAWHRPTTTECDCPDYVSPPKAPERRIRL